jgi:hypothetical protein
MRRSGGHGCDTHVSHGLAREGQPWAVSRHSLRNWTPWACAKQGLRSAMRRIRVTRIVSRQRSDPGNRQAVQTSDTVSLRYVAR